MLGEGAAILLLEELEHAQGPGGRRSIAEVVGYGATCDAYHMTAPRPDGSGGAKAMAMALADGGVKPEEVDYINAHGTSTPPERRRRDRRRQVGVRRPRLSSWP